MPHVADQKREVMQHRVVVAMYGVAAEIERRVDEAEAEKVLAMLEPDRQFVQIGVHSDRTVNERMVLNQ